MTLLIPFATVLTGYSTLFWLLLAARLLFCLVCIITAGWLTMTRRPKVVKRESSSMPTPSTTFNEASGHSGGKSGNYKPGVAAMSQPGVPAVPNWMPSIPPPMSSHSPARTPSLPLHPRPRRTATIIPLIIPILTLIIGYGIHSLQVTVAAASSREDMYQRIITRVNLVAIRDDGIDDQDLAHRWHLAYLDDPDPVYGGFDTRFCHEPSRPGPPFDPGMRIDTLAYLDMGRCWSIDPSVSQKLGYHFHREQGKIVRVSLPFDTNTSTTPEEPHEQARK